MAELTPEQKEIASLKAQLEAAQSQNTQLVAAVKDTAVALPVTGSFKANMRVEGKNVEKTFGFKKGHRYFRDEKATIFPSELVMKVANGKTLTDEETKEYPSTLQLTKEIATALLQRLADLGYAGLEESK